MERFTQGCGIIECTHIVGYSGCIQEVWYGRIYQGNTVLKVVAKKCGMVGYI